MTTDGYTVSMDDVRRWIEKTEHEHDNFSTWSEGHAVHRIFSNVMGGVAVDGYRRDDGRRAIRYRGKNDKKESIRFQSDGDAWFLWEWLDGIGVIEHFEGISMKAVSK